MSINSEPHPFVVFVLFSALSAWITMLGLGMCDITVPFLGVWVCIVALRFIAVSSGVLE